MRDKARKPASPVEFLSAAPVGGVESISSAGKGGGLLLGDTDYTMLIIGRI